MSFDKEFEYELNEVWHSIFEQLNSFLWSKYRFFWWKVRTKDLWQVKEFLFSYLNKLLPFLDKALTF